MKIRILKEDIRACVYIYIYAKKKIIFLFLNSNSTHLQGWSKDFTQSRSYIFL